MEGFPYSEAEAWAIVTKPLPRRLYQHRRDWNRLNNRRLNWLRRVSRTAEGCWMWAGSTKPAYGRKRPSNVMYPVYVVRIGDRADNRTSRGSAFWWMISEWFPPLADYYRTETTCGNTLCVSPVHRVRHKAINGNARLTPDQVMAIYNERGKRPGREVAAEFGMTQATVYAIWCGKSWPTITGHVRAKYRDQEPTVV